MNWFKSLAFARSGLRSVAPLTKRYLIEILIR